MNINRQQLRSTGYRLFAFLLALFVLTAAGYLAQGDEESMYRVTRNLIGGQGAAIGREAVTLPGYSASGFLPTQNMAVETTSAVSGADGGLYSKYAPGQSLLALPLFVLGGLLDLAWSMWPQLGSRLLMAMLNPLALAATGWLLLHFVVRLGYSTGLGVVIALTFGLSTMVWPYINTFYPQPATGFLLLFVAFAFFRWQLNGRPRWVWWIGWALGAAFLMRPTALIVLPGLAVALWLQSRSWPERFRVAGRVGLPLLIAAGITLFYNWLRFGSPFNSGYYEVAWTTPPLLGLFGLLFSSGKGVFLYAPILLLSVGALPLFYQKQRLLALMITLWWVAYLAFYAPYNFWTGGVNWGPRFLLPLVAVSLLPCATLLHQKKIRLAMPLFGALFVLGLMIQLPAVLGDHVRYLVVQQQTGDERFYDRTIFNPEFSPIVQQSQSTLAVLANVADSEKREAAAQIIRQTQLPPAGSEINRQSAQRVLQTDFIRLNWPALWWLHLPLWGAPGWLVTGLALPWILLLLWGAWGLIINNE